MEGSKLTQQTLFQSFAKASTSKPTPTDAPSPPTPSPAAPPTRTMGPTYYPKLKQIADETLAVLDIKNAKYQYNGRTVEIRNELQLCNQNTRYYPPEARWRAIRATPTSVRPTVKATVLNITTVECARLLTHVRARASPAPPPSANGNANGAPRSGVGVLNFASATLPGGGFRKGTQAQEESIARVSSLFPSLVTVEGQQFHALHKAPGGERDGWYTHAMVYSPGVIFFRDDDGTWAPSYTVDVLTSAAVNAGEVRRKAGSRSTQAVEDGIEKEMRERMARALCLFEKEGVRDLVLGSYGTGVFRNDVGVVAGIWADLLIAPGAPFAQSFDRVMFAITGDATFREFETTFKNKTAKKPAQATGWGFSIFGRSE